MLNYSVAELRVYSLAPAYLTFAAQPTTLHSISYAPQHIEALIFVYAYTFFSFSWNVQEKVVDLQKLCK